MPPRNARIIGYDPSIYDFRGWASSELGVVELEKLHLRADVRTYAPRDVVSQIDLCRRQLLDNFARCEALYVGFVAEVLGPLVGGVRSFQRPPTFRFHYSQRGSSAFHRDRDYGVKPGRLNAWVPLTPVWGDNSLWIESEEGCENYSPVELEVGQCLVFDGANLRHGSRWNSTSSTRVSFDLRFIGADLTDPGRGHRDE